VRRMTLRIVLGLLSASLVLVTAHSPQSQVAQAASEYAVQAVKDLAPYSPRLTAVDPYANAGGVDSLKPARPFWYSVDTQGLTILQLDSNKVMYRVTWPASFDVVQPDGEFVTIGAPSAGWEPVGMTVSYPTEEALASSSETPPTYVYVVMAHSGYEWGSNPNPPDLRSRNLRDTLALATSPETESAILLQVDVTDPTFSPESYPAGPVVAGAILGHGAGQPAYDPATGNIYVGNMPSTSLPTTPTAPKDLTSFVSVIAGIAPPEAGEAVVGPPEGGLGASLILRCGPEHPEIGFSLACRWRGPVSSRVAMVRSCGSTRACLNG